MDEALAAFLKVLDPADNSTGGGTASAVAGAMAAALVSMVARLSLGKPGMESESFYREIILQAEDLSRRLYQGGAADSQAFEAIRAAYKLPKADPRRKRKTPGRHPGGCSQGRPHPLGKRRSLPGPFFPSVEILQETFQ